VRETARAVDDSVNINSSVTAKWGEFKFSCRFCPLNHHLTELLELLVIDGQSPIKKFSFRGRCLHSRSQFVSRLKSDPEQSTKAYVSRRQDYSGDNGFYLRRIMIVRRI